MSRAAAWIGIGASACSVAIGGFVVAKAVIANRARQSAHEELIRQETLARQEGIPLTPAEFAPSPPVPDSQNAAPLYKQAADLIGKAGKMPLEFGSARASAVAGSQENRAYLEKVKPALALVAMAVKRPFCDLRLIPSATALDFPQLSEFRSFAKLAVGQAAVEASDGKPAKSLETLATYAPICRHLAQSHSEVPALVQIACEAIFAREIDYILSHFGATPGVPTAARKATDALGPQPDLALMVGSENLFSLDVLSPANMNVKPRSGGDSTREGEAANAVDRLDRLAQRPGLLDRWRALQIEGTRRYVVLFKSPTVDYAALEKAADALSGELLKPDDEAHAFRNFAPNQWGNPIDVIARSISQLRVLSQAAAILEASRSRPGTAAGSKLTFPDKLQFAGPDAIDPLSGKPLHYSHTATGFTVYGVGPHGVDHGGKARVFGVGGQDFDIVFTYPAPPDPPKRIQQRSF